jgi:hypothetical protein
MRKKIKMKTLLLTVAFVALAAPTVAAQPRFDWAPTIIYTGGRAADQWSTQRFLTNGSGCVEQTAILGTHPSPTALTAYNASGVAVVAGGGYLVHRLIGRTHPTLAKRLNLAIGIAGGANGVHTALANNHNCKAVSR